MGMTKRVLPSVTHFEARLIVVELGYALGQAEFGVVPEIALDVREGADPTTGVSDRGLRLSESSRRGGGKSDTR